MDISEIRRANLLTLIREAGSRQLFIERTGKSDAQISQLLSSGKNSRNIGSKLARDFEEAMGKEKGWMDHFTLRGTENFIGAQFYRDMVKDQSIPDDIAVDLYNKFLEEEREKNIPPTDLSMFEDEVSRLEDESGGPESEEASIIGHIDAWDSQTPLGPEEVELPLFREVEISGGAGATRVDEVPGSKLRFARSTLRRAGVIEEYAACAIVHGNSMEPMMPDGACIGIDTSDTKIRDGKVYAIDHDGMLRVKILHRKPGGGLKVVSMNHEEHPTEEYSPEYVAENIRIKGRVFWYSGLL